MNLDHIDQMIRYWLSAAMVIIALMLSYAPQQAALALTCLILMAAFLLMTAATRFCPVFFALDIHHGTEDISSD